MEIGSARRVAGSRSFRSASKNSGMGLGNPRATRRAVMKKTNRLGEHDVSIGPSTAVPIRHALRDQEALWAEFLAMGLTAVDSISKSIAVLCEGRLEVVHEVKSLERA